MRFFGQFSHEPPQNHPGLAAFGEAKNLDKAEKREVLSFVACFNKAWDHLNATSRQERASSDATSEER